MKNSPHSMSADEVIERLGLEPLPGEGGWFFETYRAPGVIPGSALPDHHGDRVHSTQIYYLLRSGSASAFHRVRSDEVFHFYFGSPVTQVRVSPEGRVERLTIGHDLIGGARPQVVVPAGWWQGALLTSDLSASPDPNAFALLGCTVSPGFEWDDFELIDQQRDAAVIESARTLGSWVDRLAGGS